MERVTKVFAYAASVGMLLMMCITVVDVITRYVIRRTIAGAPELAEFLMVVVIFWVWGYCATRRSHVAVSIFVDQFSPRVRNVIEMCFLPFVFFLYGIMAWRMVLETFQQRSVSTVLHIPKSPFYGLMALGVILLCLGIIKLMFEDVKFFRTSQRS